MRHGRTTVGVPCGSAEISAESDFCAHCEKLFMAGFNDDGFVELDEESMSETFELYEPGKPVVLWNSPPVVHAEDLFSAQVQEVKDKMHDTEFELDQDWTNTSFREIAASLLIGGGVLFDDADRSRNPDKRALATSWGWGRGYQGRSTAALPPPKVYRLGFTLII